MQILFNLCKDLPSYNNYLSLPIRQIDTKIALLATAAFAGLATCLVFAWHCYFQSKKVLIKEKSYIERPELIKDLKLPTKLWRNIDDVYYIYQTYDKVNGKIYLYAKNNAKDEFIDMIEIYLPKSHRSQEDPCQIIDFDEKADIFKLKICGENIAIENGKYITCVNFNNKIDFLSRPILTTYEPFINKIQR